MTGPDPARPRLAVTPGDPAGVGPRIVRDWLAEGAPRPGGTVVILGPPEWLSTLATPPGVALAEVATARRLAWPRPGHPTRPGARMAWAALEAAAAGAVEGRWEAVVTGPVSKQGLAEVGWGFAGQTEFFAARWGGQPAMAFAGGRLRVALTTWHLPLRAVSRALTRERLARACEAAAALAQAAGVATPRIAVCGLNPHAGEAGLLGTEERDRLDPWLRTLRRRLPGLSRCLPGDTVFQRTWAGEFDAIVAQYHDQGLAPLKALEFEQAVNLTLGLPYLRTSPDHGTAFALAGEGSPPRRGSWERAVALAVELSMVRRAGSLPRPP